MMPGPSSSSAPPWHPDRPAASSPTPHSPPSRALTIIDSEVLEPFDELVLFYGGLALLLFLLGFFFICESSFAHRTRSRERSYLSNVMVIAYVWIICTSIFFEGGQQEVDENGDTPFDVMAKYHPFIRVLPTTLEFTVVLVVTTTAMLGMVPANIHRFSGSWPLNERFVPGSYSAKVRTGDRVQNQVW